MTHIEKVKKLAAEKKITVLDLNELLRLEVDRHLSDVEFYDSGTANVYIPTTFDVDAAFGLDVCENSDYINLYINYNKRVIWSCLSITVIIQLMMATLMLLLS